MLLVTSIGDAPRIFLVTLAKIIGDAYDVFNFYTFYFTAGKRREVSFSCFYICVL